MMTRLKSIASIFSFALPAAFALHSNLLYVVGLISIIIWISCKIEEKRRQVRVLEQAIGSAAQTR